MLKEIFLSKLVFEPKKLSVGTGYHQYSLNITSLEMVSKYRFIISTSLLAQLVNNLPAGDPGSIPGSGRSAGEGIGYPVQYSWASLVAQLVKSLPTMQETWVQSLGWEDTLEKGKATHSHILAWIVTHD